MWFSESYKKYYVLKFADPCCPTLKNNSKRKTNKICYWWQIINLKGLNSDSVYPPPMVINALIKFSWNPVRSLEFWKS